MEKIVQNNINVEQNNNYFYQANKLKNKNLHKISFEKNASDTVEISNNKADSTPPPTK